MSQLALKNRETFHDIQLPLSKKPILHIVQIWINIYFYKRMQIRDSLYSIYQCTEQFNYWYFRVMVGAMNSNSNISHIADQESDRLD